jgi:hypothetical protein
MELALNLVWLAVAITAAVRFAVWRRDQRASRQLVVALCAVCVLALLFPIVSVTDDLHTDAAAAEETSAMRRVALVTITHVATLAVAVTPFDLAAGTAHLTQRAGLVDTSAHIAKALEGFAAIASLRGPPSFYR